MSKEAATSPSNRLSQKKRRKIKDRVGVWTKDIINFRIQQVEKELSSTTRETPLSKTRKRLLRCRLAKLQKALNGEILVGGQLPKTPRRKPKKGKDGYVKPSKCKKVCLCCRKKGHTLQECTFNLQIKESENASESGERKINASQSLCFKCGSTTHTLSSCPSKASKEEFLPFATCFICGEKGHLALACSKNKTGIYPHGGCCHICQSRSHLMRDCPNRILTKESCGKTNIEEPSKKVGVTDEDNDAYWD